MEPLSPSKLVIFQAGLLVIFVQKTMWLVGMAASGLWVCAALLTCWECAEFHNADVKGPGPGEIRTPCIVFLDYSQDNAQHIVEFEVLISESLPNQTSHNSQLNLQLCFFFFFFFFFSFQHFDGIWTCCTLSHIDTKVDR